MLVAMAGLPGSGKSTLAARLADALGGAVLSKDVARAALFPPAVINYSSEQDEIAMAAVYAAAASVLRADPGRAVLLDGRTFSKPGQIDAPLALAKSIQQTLYVIECVCSGDIARARVAADHAAGTHPAGNRTTDLYDRAKAAATPLAVPRLTLDTGTLSIEECVARARAYLGL